MDAKKFFQQADMLARRAEQLIKDRIEQRVGDLLDILSMSDLDILASEQKDSERYTELINILDLFSREKITLIEAKQELYPDEISTFESEETEEKETTEQLEEQEQTVQQPLEIVPSGYVKAQYIGRRVDGSFSVLTSEGMQQIFKDKTYYLPIETWANVQQFSRSEWQQLR